MNYDPLLASADRPYDIPQLEEEQRKIAGKIEQLKQRQPQPQQSAKCPIWDEIDSIVSGMSDQELYMMNNNDEFKESSANVQNILQREYLRIMRPIVENTKDGKDALDKHLTLIKRLRKTARDEVNKKYSIMDEYLENYSDMSFNEFMELKKKKK